MDVLARAISADGHTVLITGETGTGKELAARAVHDFGLAGGSPFVAINSASVQPHLLESELFGHEKGAFTDAMECRHGLFESCGNGTLFFDEIGELPEPLQAKLLRVIQEREFRRVGGNKTLSFAGRLVLATNRDLEKEIQQQRFRSDLYYRINTHHVHLPPLRERREDWRLLAECFLAKHARSAGIRLSQSAKAILGGCDFPGNVRQLEHAIQYCLSHTPLGQILPSHLPPELLAKPQSQSKPEELIFPVTWLDAAYKTGIAQLEATFSRQYLPRLLQSCRNNVSQAAKTAGLDQKTFRKKWEEAGLPPLGNRG